MAAIRGISDDAVFDAWRQTGSISGTFELLGLSRSNRQRARIKRVLEERGCYRPAFTPVVVPDTIRTPDELIQNAIAQRKRIQAHFRAKHDSTIPIHTKQPFGVALIPDQHADNPGSNLELIFNHAKLIAKTDGLYAAELGDLIDNFIIGKLEAARREHIVTVRESWSLAEEYHKILAPKLLAAISGNHLAWTTALGGVDHLQSVLYKAGVKALYDADELYFSIQAENQRTWKYGLRHFFQGGSLWNAAHSIVRYAMSHAYRQEDVIAAGHKHVAGYNLVESRGKKVHCVQTGAYKDRDYDDYCRTKGFMAQHAFLCPVMIHFPETGKSVFMPEVEDAVPYLKYLRGRK